MKRLTIGLLKRSEQWDNLLNQLGVPWEEFSPGKTPDDFHTLIVNASVGKEDKEWILAFLKHGGGVLVTMDHAGDFGQVAKIPSLDAFSFSNPSLRSVGSGAIGILPFSSSITRQSPCLRRFYGGGKFAEQIVSSLPLGKLRKTVEFYLINLSNKLSLPLILLSPYPHGFHSAFAFRVDADVFHEGDLITTMETAKKHNIALTTFVNAHLYPARALSILSKNGADIQMHGFRHCVYPLARRNFMNIKRIQDYLRKRGHNCNAFAAPFGIWNTNLVKAVSRAELMYTSEFSYDYDNLPSRPYLHNKPQAALQIPIHPICIGSLLEKRYSASQMKSYFKHVIDLKVHSGEPVFLYGHPTGRLGTYSDVFDFSLAHARSKSPVWFTTLSDFAAWWKIRESSQYSAYIKGDRVIINSSSSPLCAINIIYGGKSLQRKCQKQHVNLRTIVHGGRPTSGFQWQAQEAAPRISSLKRTLLVHYLNFKGMIE